MSSYEVNLPPSVNEEQLLAVRGLIEQLGGEMYRKQSEQLQDLPTNATTEDKARNWLDDPKQRPAVTGLVPWRSEVQKDDRSLSKAVRHRPILRFSGVLLPPIPQFVRGSGRTIKPPIRDSMPDEL